MRSRPEEFKCRVRKRYDEAAARRSLWAAQQRDPALNALEVKWCRVCECWHWVRKRG